MGNYADYNSRNIFELFSTSRVLFLSIDALDFKDRKGSPDPKMKIRCCEYDDQDVSGSRIKSEVSVYVPIGSFLVLAHDVLFGSLPKRRYQLEQSGQMTRYSTFFEQFGGSKGPPVVSTKLSLVPGMGKDAAFAILATSGPGRISKTGGIIPVPPTTTSDPSNSVPSKSVYINMPNDKLKEMCLIGKAYIEQFIALDLETRLQSVRSARTNYSAKREEEYLSKHGNDGGSNFG